jgi:hypothetical protein
LVNYSKIDSPHPIFPTFPLSTLQTTCVCLPETVGVAYVVLLMCECKQNIGRTWPLCGHFCVLHRSDVVHNCEAWLTQRTDCTFCVVDYTKCAISRLGQGTKQVWMTPPIDCTFCVVHYTKCAVSRLGQRTKQVWTTSERFCRRQPFSTNLMQGKGKLSLGHWRTQQSVIKPTAQKRL